VYSGAGNPLTLRIERVRARIRLSGHFRSEHVDQVKAEIELCESPAVLDLEELGRVGVEHFEIIEGPLLQRFQENGVIGVAEKLGELFGTGWPEIGKGKLVSFPKRRRACWEQPTSTCKSVELVAGVRFELTTFGL
jgi:hypothetical protein